VGKDAIACHPKRKALDHNKQPKAAHEMWLKQPHFEAPPLLYGT
jgi:hypothetical protein